MSLSKYRQTTVSLQKLSFSDNLALMPIPMVNIREVAHAVEIFDRIAPPAMVDRALRAAGLNRKVLRVKTGFVPYYLQATIFEYMARAIGDTNIVLRGAQAFEYSTFGAYSKFVLAAPDLKTAFARGRLALPMTHPGADVFVKTTEKYAFVHFRSGLERMVGGQYVEEGAVSVMFNVFRHFLGNSWKPAWVELAGNIQSRIGDIEEIVGTEVRASAVSPAICFPIQHLTAPNPKPQHPNELITLSELPKLMGATPPKNMSDLVSEVLRIQLELGDMSEESVCRRLLIGSRKLQRVLKTEGTNFREIKSTFIQDRACELLSETDFSVDQIAAALGYSEPDNFRRFFKKSTGFTPGEYKAVHAESKHYQ
jgi:AraC-like DNA-binding protein